MPHEQRTPALAPEYEAFIVQLLDEAADLVELVAQQLPEKGTGYYLQSLFLVMRQMGYFFTHKNSPLASQVGKLSQGETDIAERIRTIRVAIGHRESEKNFLTPHFKLVGGMRYAESDVEVQFGQTKIRLLREVLGIHRRYRHLFEAAPECDWLPRHPSWAVQERGLATAEALLTEKLANPQTRSKHGAGHVTSPQAQARPAPRSLLPE